MTMGLDRCPRCASHHPHLRPTVREGGEVTLCPNNFHRRVTPENTPGTTPNIAVTSDWRCQSPGCDSTAHLSHGGPPMAGTCSAATR